MKVKSESEVAQSCPTPSDPHGLQPTRLLVPGIFQASVLEWVAIVFSNLVSKAEQIHLGCNVSSVYVCGWAWWFFNWRVNWAVIFLSLFSLSGSGSKSWVILWNESESEPFASPSQKKVCETGAFWTSDISQNGTGKPQSLEFSWREPVCLLIEFLLQLQEFLSFLVFVLRTILFSTIFLIIVNCLNFQIYCYRVVDDIVTFFSCLCLQTLFFLYGWLVSSLLFIVFIGDLSIL